MVHAYSSTWTGVNVCKAIQNNSNRLRRRFPLWEEPLIKVTKWTSKRSPCPSLSFPSVMRVCSPRLKGELAALEKCLLCGKRTFQNIWRNRKFRTRVPSELTRSTWFSSSPLNKGLAQFRLCFTASVLSFRVCVCDLSKQHWKIKLKMFRF